MLGLRELVDLYRERMADADWRYQELLGQLKTLTAALPAGLVRKAREPRLHHKLGVFGAGLAAVDGGFGAPLGGEAAHSLVYVFVEAQQVADYTAI